MYDFLIRCNIVAVLQIPFMIQFFSTNVIDFSFVTLDGEATALMVSKLSPSDTVASNFEA